MRKDRVCQKYALGVEPEPDVAVMLHHLARSAHEVSDLPYFRDLSFHLDLVPQFALRHSATEDDLQALVDQVIGETVPFMTHTRTIEYLLNPSAIGIALDNPGELQALHAKLLAGLRSIRSIPRRYATPMQRDFGSEFVLERYRPHFILAPTDNRDWPTDPAFAIGTEYVFDLPVDHISVFRQDLMPARMPPGLPQDYTPGRELWQRIYRAEISPRVAVSAMPAR